MYYVALVHADESSIGFTIPDIPGFTADIETTDMDAAISEATRILAAHLEELAKIGPVPHARGITPIRRDPDCAQELADASLIVFLPALRPMGRNVRVNLSLDENTLAIIDREAKDRGITRSALVQAATLALIEGRTTTFGAAA